MKTHSTDCTDFSAWRRAELSWRGVGRCQSSPSMGEKTSVTSTDCRPNVKRERRAHRYLGGASVNCKASMAGRNRACRGSIRRQEIAPRANPGCAKSSAPSDRLLRRASQRVSGPRGRRGRTVCAKTSAKPSTCRLISRTWSKCLCLTPSALASSSVGRARPWYSRLSAKLPRACRRAVSDPRSSNQPASRVALRGKWVRQATRFL